MFSSEAEIMQALKSHLHLPRLHLQFVKKLINEEDNNVPQLQVFEYKCCQDFGWSIECIRQMILTSVCLTASDDQNFDLFLTNSSHKGIGYFLLNITGEVISRSSISSKNIPDIFQQELKGLHQPYILARVVIKTVGGLTVTLYGDSQRLLPLVPGVSYHFTDVEITVSPPFVAWIGCLTTAAVVCLEKCAVGIHGMDSAKRSFMWDVIQEPIPATNFLIKSRILKLIKLELSVDQSKVTDYVSAKLVMSMDDSSCGFLGVCYDVIVAHMLSINKPAWMEICERVKQKGPISMGLGTEECDSGLERLLRQCFIKSSLQSNREMLVMLMGNSSQGFGVQTFNSGSDGRTVPFRSCIDRQKNLWATFKTKVHKSYTVKVLNVS